MQFFLIFLFAWLIQCGESVPKRSAFKFNASIYDGGNIIYRPHSSGMSYDLYDYPDELCNWLLLGLPQNITQRRATVDPICNAVPLTKANNHTKDWAITLQLITETSDGPLISLTCPSFGESYKYFLDNLVSHFSKSQLKFTVLGYQPVPTPFDLKKARDTEFKVNAYLCDKMRQPIPVSKSNNFTEGYMKDVIKKMHLVNLGYALVTSSEVKITSIENFNGIGKIFTTITLLYPKMYVETLHINPYCDTENLIQMAFTNIQGDADFFLCGVTVQVVPPPTEKPTTVKPTTTKPIETETTALASTTKRPMEMLVCGFILSHLLANI